MQEIFKVIRENIWGKLSCKKAAPNQKPKDKKLSNTLKHLKAVLKD